MNGRSLLPQRCGGDRALDWNDGKQKGDGENVGNYLKITLIEVCLIMECREAKRKKIQASDLNPPRSWEAEQA